MVPSNDGAEQRPCSGPGWPPGRTPGTRMQDCMQHRTPASVRVPGPRLSADLVGEARAGVELLQVRVEVVEDGDPARRIKETGLKRPSSVS